MAEMAQLAKLLYQDYLGVIYISGKKIQYAVTQLTGVIQNPPQLKRMLFGALDSPMNRLQLITTINTAQSTAIHYLSIKLL